MGFSLGHIFVTLDNIYRLTQAASVTVKDFCFCLKWQNEQFVDNEWTLKKRTLVKRTR